MDQQMAARDALIAEVGARLAAADPRLAPPPSPGSPAAPAGFDGTDPTPFVELTLLRPQATREEVAALCDAARAAGTAGACVNPLWAGLAAERLAGSAVRVVAVVGFPLGASPSAAVAAEARAAVAAGVEEVDMVLPLGLLRSGLVAATLAYLEEVVAACGAAPLKVILETCKLEEAELVAGCLLSRAAGAGFVKTSTGFSLDRLGRAPHTGATVADVALMRRAVGDAMGVKASGGIRTRADAVALLRAGATRLGASVLPA